jgi:hypothetical protein
MKNEYLYLDRKQVGIVTALNSVHKTQNFHPWTIEGEEGYYLYKEYQTKDGIPKAFLDFFKTLSIRSIIDARIELINLDEFNSYAQFELRAAFNPYDIDNLPERLYHYTNADGMLGILSSRKLWATHYSFLNDYNEFEYAKGLIRDTLMNFLEDSENDVAIKTNWKIFEDQFKYYNTFLVSFSTAKDRLSQWRAYANYCKGYSLGFRTENIGLATPPKERSQTFIIRPVLYDPLVQREIIEDTIRQTILEINKMPEPFKGPYHYSSEFYKLLHWKSLLSIVTFKSKHFEEECEWRAIHMQTDFDNLYPDNLEIRFRSNSEHLIPFIELDLNSEIGDKSERFPLNEIVYGPTLNHELAQKSLTLLSKKMLKKNIVIEKSNLTLR